MYFCDVFVYFCDFLEFICWGFGVNFFVCVCKWMITWKSFSILYILVVIDDGSDE